MIRERWFSVISIVLIFLIFSRMTLNATSINSQSVTEAQVKKVEKTSTVHDNEELVYDNNSINPILESTSNIDSFNQKKYACSGDDEGICEEDEELPCKACAVASGVNCGISVCTFGVAVVAMVIAALVIANSGHDNAYGH